MACERGDRPRSFRSADEASGDPLASALFGVEGVTNVLMNGDWVSVNKSREASWRTVKAGVKRALAEVTAS